MEIVDEEGDTGLYPSLIIEADGSQHIAYYDHSEGDLRYATRSNGSWDFETVDSGGDTGLTPSLVLDAEGNPWISYYDRTNWQVKLAHKSDGEWRIETVDDSLVPPVEEKLEDRYNTSMVLDAKGNPWIAYVDYMWTLHVARREGGRWHLEVVDKPNSVDWRCSMALDMNGLPGISYYDSEARALKLARWKEGAWYIEMLEPNKVGKYSSLVFDSRNYPQIAYFDEELDDLRYIGWNGYSLFPTKVDYEGGVGLFTSIALNSHDKPYVTYYDFSNGWLKFSYKVREYWSLTLADRSADVGRYSSIQFHFVY